MPHPEPTTAPVQNPASPMSSCGIASWLLLEDRGDRLVATQRNVPYDVEAVVCDLRRRRHPNAEFVASVLTGQRQM
jgi:hypothetical protein